MTKSTGKGRGKGGGGAKPGAGRKRKAVIAQAIKPETIAAAALALARLQSAQAGPASELAGLAYATLRQVMESSPFPASRVTAARVIIDLAKAEQASANEPTGKKAERVQAAHVVATKPTDEWGDDLMLPGSRAN